MPLHSAFGPSRFQLAAFLFDRTRADDARLVRSGVSDVLARRQEREAVENTRPFASVEASQRNAPAPLATAGRTTQGETP